MKTVEELNVFKKSHELVIKLYKLTIYFPKEEKYGLISQVRRAAASINANLMEGSHRNTRGEYKQFIGISRGSVGELKYHLLLAKDLGYISKEEYLEFKDKINEVSRMLTGLLKAL
ncbi:four helix bundle protein [Orenia marismortui]|uniref:Four helix bundle protein n=1 Tax=Orenia marismortui TaxID=46469 RepID=A0A4R8HKY4_9FIRM|nr:four helix bundle protein [Orenia marismortui]TDX58914.1 four helix bundle protein [Orenia marismortui]